MPRAALPNGESAPAPRYSQAERNPTAGTLDVKVNETGRTPPRRTKRRGQGRRGRRRRRFAPVLAAIDVGTNSCRLLIAVPENGQPRIVDAFSANVRLGEGIAKSGAIAPAAMDRTIAALKTCAARIKNKRVTHVRAIATEACRRASNSAELIARARDEAGIALAIVTPEQEAHLAAESCAPLIGAEHEGALVVDIGGGSTELVWIRPGAGDGAPPEVAAWTSLPIGVVTLAERHGGAHLPGAVYATMAEEAAEILAQSRGPMPDAHAFDMERNHLLGTSGTTTTLAAISIGLARYERRRVDGAWLDRTALEAIMRRVVPLDFAGRAAIPCIGDDRADLIVPGCAILAAVIAQWPCRQMRVADRGLREGLLIGLMREAAAEAAQGVAPHKHERVP